MLSKVKCFSIIFAPSAAAATENAPAGADHSYVVVQEPRLVVSVGAAVTVGLGKTMVTDLYQLGDL